MKSRQEVWKRDQAALSFPLGKWAWTRPGGESSGASFTATLFFQVRCHAREGSEEPPTPVADSYPIPRARL